MKNLILLIIIYLFGFAFSSGQTLWEQTNGPYSGKLTSITKDSQGFLYTITSNYCLYRSKDNSENWEKISKNISAIAFDIDNNCYIGSDSGKISLYDKDLNFVKLLTKLDYLGLHVDDISIDSKGNIYAEVFYGGLYLSTDQGITWNKIHEAGFSQISLDSNNVIIMTFYSNFIRRSTNQGKDWFDIIINDAPFRQGIYYTEFNKSFNNFIAVGFGNIIYLSNDLGITWQPLIDSIPIHYVEAVVVDEKGDVYIAGDSLVCRSTDGGYSWNKLEGFPKVRGQSLINKDNYIFSATWSNGIVRYDNSTLTGEKKNTSIINSNINQLAINKNNDVFAATTSGIYKSTNSGDYWEQLVLPHNSDIDCNAILYSKSGNIYVSCEQGLLISKDEGLSWNIIANIDTLVETITTLAESENGRIYVGNRYLYYSDDKGITWQSIDLNVNEIVSIATYKNNYVLVGTYMEGIYYSEDECHSFIKLPLDVPENYGTNVTFNKKGELFISMNAWQGGDAIFRSIDSGNTFTELPELDDGVKFIKIDKNNYIYTFSYSDDRAYYSKDNGDSWLLLNEGSIESIYINDICFGNNNEAFIGTFYDGVFKTDNLAEIFENIPISQIDFEITPNPATDIISILFKDENYLIYGVHCSIVNSLGMEMKLKPFEDFKPFEGSVINFSTESFPSGVYYFSINFGINRITKSFVIAK
jgi:photosystem II stability/assembly factor-like uncharacterized protein